MPRSLVPHRYEVGEVVGDMRILAQTRTRDKRGRYCKCYDIQCVVCGNEKNMQESHLAPGAGVFHSTKVCAPKAYMFEVGTKIGDYTVIAQTVKPNNRGHYQRAYYLECQVCGWQKTSAEFTIKAGDGLTHSGCGYGQKGRGSRFYKIWDCMKNRCDNPNFKYYPAYGGRGIKHFFPEFLPFKALMEESYLAHCEEHEEWNTTLDRIDPDGHYEEGNIRWATWKVQANNQRDSHYYKCLMPSGELSVFARKTVLKYGDKGPSVEDGVFDLLDPFPAVFTKITKEQYVFWHQAEAKLDSLTDAQLRSAAEIAGIQVGTEDSFEFVRNKLVEYFVDKMQDGVISTEEV